MATLRQRLDRIEREFAGRPVHDEFQPVRVRELTPAENKRFGTLIQKMSGDEQLTPEEGAELVEIGRLTGMDGRRFAEIAKRVIKEF